MTYLGTLFAFTMTFHVSPGHVIPKLCSRGTAVYLGIKRLKSIINSFFPVYQKKNKING
jgi:hypothetical protein